jgi:K(+)-stimulated pyrophosphate-energized sodium pump
MIVGFFIWQTILWETGVSNIYFILFPLVGTAIAILATLLSVPVVKLSRADNPIVPLRNGLVAVSVISAVGLYFAIMYMFNDIYLYYALLVGLVASVLMYFITDYYTSSRYKPVQDIARSSTTGPATTILSGLAVSFECTFLPIVMLTAALLISFYFGYISTTAAVIGPVMAGIYGTVLATRGILSVCGMVLAMDGFGPIVDNACGIAEMSGRGARLRKRMDALDAVGNTTKALTKGYAMACAALAALLLFRAYADVVKEIRGEVPFVVDVFSMEVLAGAFLGALLPFIFTGLALRGVKTATFEMVREVRRQFKTIPGLMEGKAKPDYSRCVDISTRISIQQMVAPTLLMVIFPLSAGFLLGAEAVGALLVTATLTGIPLAMLMNTGGGAFDNAKKFIEDGHFGGKGSPAHAAGVVGDTVGDPLKDTVGPSLHVLIKMLNTLTLVFASLFLMYTLVPF